MWTILTAPATVLSSPEMRDYNCPTCGVAIASNALRRNQRISCPSCGAPLVLEKSYRRYVERLHPFAIAMLMLLMAALWLAFDRWLPELIAKEVGGTLIVFLCAAIPVVLMKIDDHFHPPVLRDTSKPKPPTYVEI